MKRLRKISINIVIFWYGTKNSNLLNANSTIIIAKYTRWWALLLFTQVCRQLRDIDDAQTCFRVVALIAKGGCRGRNPWCDLKYALRCDDFWKRCVITKSHIFSKNPLTLASFFNINFAVGILHAEKLTTYYGFRLSVKYWGDPVASLCPIGSSPWILI